MSCRWPPLTVSVSSWNHMEACLYIRHSSHLLSEFISSASHRTLSLPWRFRFCAATQVEPVINDHLTKATKEGSGSGGEHYVTRFSRACALSVQTFSGDSMTWVLWDVIVAGSCTRALVGWAVSDLCRKFQFMNFSFIVLTEVMSPFLEGILKLLLTAEFRQ